MEHQKPHPTANSNTFKSQPFERKSCGRSTCNLDHVLIKSKEEPEKMDRKNREFFSESFRLRISVPSLQHAAVVKIAIELLSQSDEDEEVTVKVAQLPIPELLKRKLLSVIRPIGAEKLNWWEYHSCASDFFISDKQLIWTPRGTIDWKKTAEMLVRNEKLDIQVRYNLACIYCIDDKIPKLWQRIPEQIQFNYRFKQNDLSMKRYNLINYWTNYTVDGVSELENAFKMAVDVGNAVATEFFFDKLSGEERDTFLVDCTKKAAHERLVDLFLDKEHYSEVFFFLMSKMSEDQQLHLLVECPYEVLTCFLDKPFQPFLMDLAQQILFFSPNDYCSYVYLLQSIAKKIQNGWTDFDYRKLFLRFLQIRPFIYEKQAFGTRKIFSNILSILFNGEEKAIIESLFEHMTVGDKVGFVLDKNFLRFLVRAEKWDSIKLFLEMCEPTKEVLVEVKERFTKRSPMKWSRERHRPKWDAFTHVLDELIEKKNEGENVDDNNYLKISKVKY